MTWRELSARIVGPRWLGEDGGMLPAPGEVLHFSEDPTITVFVPKVAQAAVESRPFVRAVDEARER